MAQQRLIHITPLPQFVPSQVCLSCDVCCRFPDEDSVLRPYFTAEEIQRAVARGLDPARFPEPAGCQVSLVPNPAGEGYLCPAFDPATHHCRIYDVRPLDCQIYPLALMWAPTRAGARREARGTGKDSGEGARQEVVLGWDSKCPFLQIGAGRGARGAEPENLAPRTPHPAPDAALRAYVDQIATLLERDEAIETVVKNPRLIGPFQDDVVILRTLPQLNARLRGGRGARGARHEAKNAAPCLLPRTPRLEPGKLRPLTLDDRPLVERGLASTDWVGETPLAAYAFAPHFIWHELFSYWLADIAGHLCLFAEYADGIFMPLPPLRVTRDALRVTGSIDSSPGTHHPSSVTRPMRDAVAACFAFMRERNNGSAVTRIENVPEELTSSLEILGYRLTPKDPDYLYRAGDLVRLAGDRYKSQRAACNRFMRTQRSRYEPYRPDQADACLALHRRWVAQQEARAPLAGGAVAQQMLRDSAAAHREALAHSRELGLAGNVVRVDGAIQAYTFGLQVTPSVFCVLLEVADRSIPGLAQFIFRECCREAAARGAVFINTMDDSGLPSLARSKHAYHPCRLIPSYVLSEAE